MKKKNEFFFLELVKIWIYVRGRVGPKEKKFRLKLVSKYTLTPNIFETFILSYDMKLFSPTLWKRETSKLDIVTKAVHQVNPKCFASIDIRKASN